MFRVYWATLNNGIEGGYLKYDSLRKAKLVCVRLYCSRKNINLIFISPKETLTNCFRIEANV